jgi:hypothetical protein
MKTISLKKLSLLAVLAGCLISQKASAAADPEAEPGRSSPVATSDVRLGEGGPVDPETALRASWARNGVVKAEDMEIRNAWWDCFGCCSPTQEAMFERIFGIAARTAMSAGKELLFTEDGRATIDGVSKGKVDAIARLGETVINHGIKGVPDDALRRRLERLWDGTKTAAGVAHQIHTHGIEVLADHGVLFKIMRATGEVTEVNIIDAILQAVPEGQRENLKLVYRVFTDLMPADYDVRVGMVFESAAAREAYWYIDVARFLAYCAAYNAEGASNYKTAEGVTTFRLFETDAAAMQALRGEDVEDADSLPIKTGSSVRIGGAEREITPVEIILELLEWLRTGDEPDDDSELKKLLDALRGVGSGVGASHDGAAAAAAVDGDGDGKEGS